MSTAVLQSRRANSRDANTSAGTIPSSIVSDTTPFEPISTPPGPPLPASDTPRTSPPNVAVLPQTVQPALSFQHGMNSTSTPSGAREDGAVEDAPRVGAVAVTPAAHSATATHHYHNYPTVHDRGLSFYEISVLALLLYLSAVSTYNAIQTTPVTTSSAYQLFGEKNQSEATIVVIAAGAGSLLIAVIVQIVRRRMQLTAERARATAEGVSGGHVIAVEAEVPAASRTSRSTAHSDENHVSMVITRP